MEGSTRAFPKTKEQYVNWGDDDMLGADGSRGSRCGRAWVGCALGACWGRWGGGWWGRRVCEAGLCHSVIVRCCLRVTLERQGRVRAGQSWAARRPRRRHCHLPLACWLPLTWLPACLPLLACLQVCQAPGALHGKGVQLSYSKASGASRTAGRAAQLLHPHLAAPLRLPPIVRPFIIPCNLGSSRCDTARQKRRIRPFHPDPGATVSCAR